MATLLDIAPSTAVEVVVINGQPLTVHGLRVPALASIAARFPDLSFLIGGTSGMSLPRLIGQLGAATGPIIAASMDELGNEKSEKIASELLAEQQLELVAAIFRLTFPNGLVSFIEKLGTLMTAGAHEGEKVTPQGPVRVRLAKRSPYASPPSSDTDFHPNLQ